MARINFDDDVESKNEFWRLLPLVGNDRDRALGMLLRFFRLAQDRFGHGIPMTDQDLEDLSLTPMVKSGWAVPMEGGYYCLGSSKHFGWYRQRVLSASMGGKTRASAPRDEHGRYLPKPSPEASEESSRTPAETQPTATPLSLSLSLSLSKRKKNTSIEQYSDAFTEAYEKYPRREGKKLGWKTYLRTVPDIETHRSLIQAIENYCKAKAGTERQYLKQFSTFMNSWEEWIQAPPSSGLPPKGRINTTPLRLEDL